MGSDLYNHLIKYFVGHLKSIREVRCLRIHPVALTPSQHAETLQDEALLKYYAEEWDRYTTGANYINRLFTYLNRHWVKRERDEGRKGVYPVYIVRTACIILASPIEYFTLARSCTMEKQPFLPHPSEGDANSQCLPPPNRAAPQRRDHRPRPCQKGRRLLRLPRSR